MAQKRYPFSAAKHAHDIELVRNRCYVLAYEAEMEGRQEEANKYWKIREEATEVSDAIFAGLDGWSGITMLSGPMIGKAKKFVFMAEELRDAMNRQHQ